MPARFYIHTYLLTPWCRVLLEKLTGSQLVKIFPAFDETRMFITVFTSARHLSLSWARSIESMHPNPTSRRSILILSYHLFRVFQVASFPRVSQPKLYSSPLPIRATCPAYLIILDLITQKILSGEFKSLSSSVCTFLHSPATSSV